MQTVVVAPGEPERFWNRTPFRSYLFNAFSLLLPSGEQFVIRAMEGAAAHLPEGAPLKAEVAQFVREERAHQRAHRLYNAQLARQGYNAVALEARMEGAVQGLEQALDWRERLALAAALEYLTALVSRQALRGGGWLVHDASRQSNLWRWHCEEEVAHHGVALRLLREVGQVSYGRRLGLYVLASLILLGDVACHTWDFFRTDRAQVLQYPRATAEDAAALDVELGILGEQCRGIAPQVLVEVEAERLFGVRAAGLGEVELPLRRREGLRAGGTQLGFGDDRQSADVGHLNGRGVEAGAKRLVDQVAIERAAGMRLGQQAAQCGKLHRIGAGGIGGAVCNPRTPVAIAAAELDVGRQQRHQRRERAADEIGAACVSATGGVHEMQVHHRLTHSPASSYSTGSMVRLKRV